MNPLFATKDQKAQSHSESGQAGISRPLHIVHLEDDTNDADLVKALLEEEGFAARVTLAQNGPEFIKAIDQGQFDAILSDFSLPGFDGKAALDMAREKCPEVPFIFVSGTLGEETAIECLRNGAIDYVLKHRLNRLGPALQRALRERDEQNRRRLAEANLHKSGELFRQIIENVADLIAVLDPDGRWLYYSPSYRSVLDNSAVQPGSDPFSRIHPEDRERMRRSFRNIGTNGEPARTEFRFLLPNGSVKFIESQASAIRDEAGNITNVVTIARDITDRKRNEERLQQIKAELEQANHELRRRNEEIQNFYHTLSHELKTPLTSAREFISIVREGLAGPLNEQQSEYLSIAQGSCNQLRVLLNDLLDTTRLETGKLRLELKRTSLTAFIHEIVTIMGPAIANKKISLSHTVEAGLPDVLIDAGRIKQVLTNLLNNALKFTPQEGKIEVAVAQSPERPDFIRISVADTGCGIPEDHIERIFDRLHQVKIGQTAREQGIGLGLYICRELVELHGGTIRADSKLGKGSSFTFEIPKCAKAARANVLVIDDEGGMVEALRSVLERAEFNVTTATGGTEAVTRLKQQVPDVILLDLNMPELDGASTLKEIRGRCGAVPVIVHTGYPDGELMERALQYAPFTVLTKPCPEAQLVQTISMLAGQRHIRQ